MCRLVAIIMVSLFLTGCERDRYYDVRPKIDSSEVWVSETPNMYFKGWDEDRQTRSGIIFLENENVEICIGFDFGRGMVCEYYTGNEIVMTDDVIFRGKCKFGEDKLIVEDIRYTTEIFNEDIDTITFEKRNYEEWLKETGGESVETTTEEL